LAAALPLAPRELQNSVQGFSKRLARHPRDLPVVRAQLGVMLKQTIAGDFRTLLNAAYDAL
jgi:hypothetical protein